jgi:hypothetical protein
MFVCRKLESKVIAAAALVGKVTNSELAVIVRRAILKSPNPGGITHMRSIEALRQEFIR